MRTAKLLLAIFIASQLLQSCGSIDCSEIRWDKDGQRWVSVDKGKVYSGTCTTKWDNGKTKIKEIISHGQYKEQLFYFETGNLESDWTFDEDNNFKTVKAYYRDNKLQRDVLFNKGVLVSAKTFYKNGKIESDVKGLQNNRISNINNIDNWPDPNNFLPGSIKYDENGKVICEILDLEIKYFTGDKKAKTNRITEMVYGSDGSFEVHFKDQLREDILTENYIKRDGIKNPFNNFRPVYCFFEGVDIRNRDAFIESLKKVLFVETITNPDYVDQAGYHNEVIPTCEAAFKYVKQNYPK
jgi:hypothetical protein